MDFSKIKLGADSDAGGDGSAVKDGGASVSSSVSGGAPKDAKGSTTSGLRFNKLAPVVKPLDDGSSGGGVSDSGVKDTGVVAPQKDVVDGALGESVVEPKGVDVSRVDGPSVSAGANDGGVNVNRVEPKGNEPKDKVSSLASSLPNDGGVSDSGAVRKGSVVKPSVSSIVPVDNPLLDDEDSFDGGVDDSDVSSSVSGGLPVFRRGADDVSVVPKRDFLVNPLLDDDDFGDFSGDVEVVDLSDDSVNLLSDGDVEVLESQKAYRDKRNSRYRFTDEDRVRKFSKSYVYRKPLSGRSSQMHVRGAVEYLVDDSGAFIYQGGERVREREGFSALVKAAEANAGVKVSDAVVERSRGGGDAVVSAPKDFGKVVYPWSTKLEVKVLEGGGRPAPGKLRLNERELDFYRRLRDTKKGVLSDEEIISELRLPVDSRVQLGERSRKDVERKLGTAVRGGANFSRWAGTAVNATDMDILQFLVRFRYANTGHIANLCGIKRESARKRMVKLRDKGLVEAVPLWGAGKLWLPTQAGAILSGYDLPIVKYNDLSHQLIPHQFAVNNIAANLFGGGVNVLDLADFPARNRFDVKGNQVFGEELVSETEMLSSFRKISWMQTSDVYRPIIKRNIEREFEEWLNQGGVDSGTMSPEFAHGNEYMWILYPPTTVVDKVYHVPDLVVKRPRNADGSPNSIAVELEAVEGKDRNKYLGVLKSYMANKTIFGKVVWVCKTIASANAIEDLSKEIGLWQEGRVNVVPILTDQGIFEGRDLWKLS